MYGYFKKQVLIKTWCSDDYYKIFNLKAESKLMWEKDDINILSLHFLWNRRVLCGF